MVCRNWNRWLSWFERAALDVLRKCTVVYIERFTSAVSEGDIKGLNSLLEVNIQPVQRWFVEDGRDIIEIARTKNVALVTYGDPLIATTHCELRSARQKLGQNGGSSFSIRHCIYTRVAACLQVRQDGHNDV